MPQGLGEKAAVPPVRVKFYGLYSLTRRAYLLQSVGEALGLVAIASFWLLGWPGLRAGIVRLPLSWSMRCTVAVLDAIPWILLGAIVYKAAELTLVLRRFAEKEAAGPLPPTPSPARGGGDRTR